GQRVVRAQPDSARGGLQRPQRPIGVRFSEVGPLWFFDESAQARQYTHGARGARSAASIPTGAPGPRNRIAALSAIRSASGSTRTTAASPEPPRAEPLPFRPRPV